MPIFQVILEPVRLAFQMNYLRYKISFESVKPHSGKADSTCQFNFFWLQDP